jgi:hypothetical protein
MRGGGQRGGEMEREYERGWAIIVRVDFAVILLPVVDEWDPITYLGFAPDPIQIKYRDH